MNTKMMSDEYQKVLIFIAQLIDLFFMSVLAVGTKL